MSETKELFTIANRYKRMARLGYTPGQILATIKSEHPDKWEVIWKLTTADAHDITKDQIGNPYLLMALGTYLANRDKKQLKSI